MVEGKPKLREVDVPWFQQRTLSRPPELVGVPILSCFPMAKRIGKLNAQLRTLRFSLKGQDMHPLLMLRLFVGFGLAKLDSLAQGVKLRALDQATMQTHTNAVF